MNLKPVPIYGGSTVITHCGWQEMKLDVRRFAAGFGSNKCTRFKVICRPEPALEEEPARADQELGKQSKLLVQTNWLFSMELKIDFRVIL